MYTDLIIAEIHQAINKLGGSTQPATPDAAQRALRGLAADIDLLSIVDSWQDTLPDEDILQLLRNRNAGLPLFQTIYASKPQDNVLRECNEPLTQHGLSAGSGCFFAKRQSQA